MDGLEINILNQIREKNTMWYCLYMELKKMIQMNLLQNSNRLAGLENKLIILN